MKKIVLASLLILSISLLCFSGCAGKEENGGSTQNGSNLIYQSVGNGECYVVDWNDSNDKHIVIPSVAPNGDRVVGIDEYAFSDFTSIEKVTIPDSVKFIGEMPFAGCSSLACIEVDENNQFFKSIDGNLYTKDGKVLIQYACRNTISSFTIPSGVTSVSIGAFDGCAYLEEINIPNGLKTIGEFAFSDCTSLENIRIPSSVEDIGRAAFSGCSSIQNITVDEDNPKYKSIDGSLYSKDGTSFIQYNCGREDANFVMPDGVLTICEYAFYQSPNIENLIISESVNRIESAAFYGCSKLESFVIPDGVELIDWHTFMNCVALKSVTIPDSVKNISNMAFSGCSSLQKVYYMGSSSQWNKISIGQYNENLTRAVKVYNHVIDEK